LTGIKTMISAATLGVGRPSFLSLRGISYRSATAVLPPGWAKPLSNATGDPALRRNGAHKISKICSGARGFLKNFGGPKPAKKTGQNW